MCITFFALDTNLGENVGKYKMILVMNRDELFTRPTSPADWGKDDPDLRILAGRDQYPGKEGGTWLAVDKSGRVGLLTNIYTGSNSNTGEGRGHLIIDYLRDPNISSHDYLEKLSQSEKNYNAFNLILLEQDTNGKYHAEYFRRQSINNSTVLEKEGPIRIDNDENKEAMGLSNHPYFQPYRKTLAGKENLSSLIKDKKFKNKKDLIDGLFNLCRNDTRYYPDPQIEKQGVNQVMKEAHQIKSAMFYYIHMYKYGSRTQTVILVDENDEVYFEERNREIIEKEKNYFDENWSSVIQEFKIE